MHKELLSFSRKNNTAAATLGDTSKKLTWEITNPHNSHRVLLITSGFNLQTTSQGSTTETLSTNEMNFLSTKKLDISQIGNPFAESMIGEQPNLFYIGLKSKDSKQDPEGFFQTAIFNDYQITRMRMTSTNLDGTPNADNYDNVVQHIFLSPFELPKITDFTLRRVAGRKDKALQYAEVDFLADGFHALVGKEDIVAITIAPESKLTAEIFLGAEMSTSQAFYREVKEIAKKLRPAAQSIRAAKKS